MKIILLIISSILLAVPAFAKKNCSYKFNLEKSKVEATGYKYTEKKGVTAQFTGFKLNKEKAEAGHRDLLKDLVVTVDLMTIDSGNSLRDKNMRETLFSNIVGDSVATVTVKKVMDKKIETEFKLNDKTQKVVFDYSHKKGTLTATGVFDVVAFAMGDQVAALKKRCGSLHTGSDGKSVTWTDFSLKVTASMDEKCS